MLSAGTWVQEVGIALLLAVALHSVWQQRHALTEQATTAQPRETPHAPPPAPPSQAVPAGFSVMPWAP